MRSWLSQRSIAGTVASAAEAALQTESTQYLCILDIPQHDFCIEHVRQLRHHLALNGELLVEQRQVVLELPVRCDEYAFALRVVLGSAGTAQHLGQRQDARVLRTKTM